MTAHTNCNQNNSLTFQIVKLVKLKNSYSMNDNHTRMRKYLNYSIA